MRDMFGKKHPINQNSFDGVCRKKLGRKTNCPNCKKEFHLKFLSKQQTYCSEQCKIDYKNYIWRIRHANNKIRMLYQQQNFHQIVLQKAVYFNHYGKMTYTHLYQIPIKCELVKLI